MGNFLDGAPPLEYLNADADSITVSGVDAGCYMAHRLQIIHSSRIKGAALFGCWPYGTAVADAWAGYNAEEADEWFFSAQQSGLQEASIDAIDRAVADGVIDSTSNIADVAAYI